MIATIIRSPRLQTFKDHCDYVLHDRDGATSERVGHVETWNLVSDPEHAHKEMQTTADAGRAIQARAREREGKRQAASGSRAERTCFHIALSWHPEDRPNTDSMFGAAQDCIARLGLSDHQALIVQHTEKPHAHLHIILSKCHPDTGRVNSLYHSGYALDRWSHEQEKKDMNIRTWNRAAKYEREHEWAKKPSKQQEAKKAQADLYEKRKREVNDKQQADKAEITKRQAARRDDMIKQAQEIRRAAEGEKQQLREEHDKQIRDYWRKSEPKPKLETRPGPEMLRPVKSQTAEIIDTMKDMQRTAPHLHPTNVERSDEPKTREKEPAPRAQEAFADRSERDMRERQYGEEAIRRWQQSRLDRVDQRTDLAIEKLREEYEIDRRLCALEWKEHAQKFELLRNDLDVEFGVKEREGPAADRAKQATESKQPWDIRSFVEDCIAGRGRDSSEFEQFYVNNGPEIEKEFQRRYAELDEKAQENTQPSADQSPSPDAPPLEPEPAYEPDPFSYYESDKPEHERSEPEPDLDWEIGD